MKEKQLDRKGSFSAYINRLIEIENFKEAYGLKSNEVFLLQIVAAIEESGLTFEELKEQFRK